MNSDFLKTTILSIIIMGFVISLAGIALYCWRDAVSQHMRFLLPIPPIGVAAYVFVCNMLAKYDGKMPGTIPDVCGEILWASLISGGFFLVFTILLVFLINTLKHIG
ncbi:MAG: hypothetical protein JRJ82_23625 [Deltaproteobacteria bacterium]|nr:hypothetical protein [Deltaproteobacteria bacterium]